MISLFIVLLALAGVIRGDEVFTIKIHHANALQPGNHSYHPPEDANLDYYKTISVMISAQKDTLGVYLTTPDPGKETVYTGVPFFSITLRNEAGSEIVTKQAFDVPIGTRSYGFRDVLTTKQTPANLIIEVTLITPIVSQFNFNLENILSVKDGTYDLKPFNTSMGTYFMLNLANNTLSWYLKRKPPIPPFVLSVYDAFGDEVVHQVVNRMSADGIGFKNLLLLNDGGPNLDMIVFKVQFRERYRSRSAHATIKNVRDLFRKLKANPQEQELIRPSADHEVLFQLQYFNSTKHIALMVVQVDGPKHPLGNLQVRATRRNTRTLQNETIFLEEERQVPMLMPHVNPQFGWYQVFATETTKKVNKTVGGKNGTNESTVEEVEVSEEYNYELSDTMEINAFYDFRPTARPEELFFEWLQDYDTNMKNVTPHVSRTGRRGCTAAVAMKPRTLVASMPYRLLLTQQVSLKYEWWGVINKHQSWKDHVDKFKVSTGLRVAASMTFFALMRASSPFDGMNWRLFFDNIHEDKDNHHQPMFWTEDELQLLHFSYVKSEAKEHRDIAESEYDAIGDAIDWFKETIPQDEYIRVRTYITARLLNISNVVLAAPLVDYLHHDDSPNVALRFDDRRRRMEWIAARNIIAGAALSMNYGTESKTKQDFLIQYGWVPVGARDAVMVKDTLLTDEKASRSVLLGELTASAGSVIGGFQEFVKVLSEKVVSLPSHIDVPKDKKINAHRASLAGRILESERYTLQKHLAWMEEDIAALSV